MSESSVENRAPEALELVQSFVNTVEVFEDRREEEELTDPEALRAWLAERGLMELSDPVSDADLTRAIDVREGLRTLLLAHNGEEADAAKVARLDRAAGRAGMHASFASGAPELVPGPAGRGRRHRAPAGHRGRVLGAGHLGASEGLPARLLPLGLLRQVEEPLEALVQHGILRERREGPRVPAPAARRERLEPTRPCGP